MSLAAGVTAGWLGAAPAIASAQAIPPSAPQDRPEPEPETPTTRHLHGLLDQYTQRSESVVFIGPPGAGKGTQGALLADRLGIPKFATGDLLRDAVKRGTPVGACSTCRAIGREMSQTS